MNAECGVRECSQAVRRNAELEIFEGRTPTAVLVIGYSGLRLENIRDLGFICDLVLGIWNFSR